MNKIIFILCLLLLTSVTFADSFIIEDFKDNNFKKYFNLRSINGEATTLNGINFAKLDYPKWEKGKEEWPATIIDFGNGNYKEKNFKKYKYLYFLIYNPTEERTINLRIDDEKKASTSFVLPLRAKGYTLNSLKTDEITYLDPTCITHFDLWTTRPEKAFTIYLGPITLGDTIDNTTLSILSKETIKDIDKELLKIKDKKGNSILSIKNLLLKNKEILSGNNYAEKTEVLSSNFMSKIPFALSNAKFFEKQKGIYSVYPCPNTVKLTKSQMPNFNKENKITLNAAKGEGESYSLIITANKKDLKNINYSASNFVDKNGNKITPELKILGYVPVKNPTAKPYGFGIKDNFPDPLMPNTKFDIKALENNTLLFSVYVPGNATPGMYTGKITIQPENEIATTIPVNLKVYNVDLPKTSYLKQCWITRNEGSKPEYNGSNWTKEDFKDFTKLNLKYRMSIDQFNSAGILDWDKVFKVNNGVVTADWTDFDKDVEYWFDQGKTMLMGYGIGWITDVSKINNPEIESQKIKLMNDHFVKNNWSDKFYLYVFDEASPSESQRIKDVCTWFHKYGKDLQLVFTDCNGYHKDMIGYADILVPHANFYNLETAKEQRKAGGSYWQYTCIGTVNTNYPDNWKIDNYGTNNKALGWWLYKYGSEGYLYWGVDYWAVNPWKSAETFPSGNGDGSMFYPAPDKKSQPYPSLRADITRDGFEDYDLLYMLNKKYPNSNNKEINNLLNAKEVIFAPDKYEFKNDKKYYELHKKILELLEK